MNPVSFFVAFISATPAALARAGQARSSALSEAIELLDSLAGKVSAEGVAEAKAYQEFEAWCDKESLNFGLQIKSGGFTRDKLQASISKATADISSSDEKIESLAGSISSDSQQLKEAAGLRAHEAADFAESEAELVDAISSLDRAVMILQKQMQKNPAAFAQMDMSKEKDLVKTLSTVIDAASFPVTDQKKLAALVQSQAQQGDASEDEDLGAPAATQAYKTRSTTIFDMLEDLKDRAEGQLGELRKAEKETKMNYQVLEISLQDQIAADKKDLDQEKAAKAASQEARSVGEGDLVEATKGLDNDKSALAETGITCRTSKEDHENTVKSRNEELTALATAKKILSETSSGAASRTYTFLELDHQYQSGLSLNSRSDLANAEVVNLLKKLAKENHSAALAQLASRISVTLRYGASNGQDPFSKVKQLIKDMLFKLQEQAQADVTEKSYCDDELAKTNAKKSDLQGQMAKLSTKMDAAAATSAQLKGDLTELSASMSRLAKSQAEMDAIRVESHQEYARAKGDLELGLEGIRKAVGLLRDYYGNQESAAMLQGDFQHTKADGAGGEVIKCLEVVESDFAKSLATEETAEADAQAEYEKTTKTNKDTKNIRELDVQFKTRELKALAKTEGDLSGDRGNTGAELDAVLEYSDKLKERCIGKAETYETRKSRREAELQGLKQALSILAGESAFVQSGKKRNLHSNFLSSN